jgi:hypothetical protein
VVPRLRQYTDSMGRTQKRTCASSPTSRDTRSRRSSFFIDGRTGAQLHTESFYEEALYNEGQNTPALSSYLS